VRVRFDRFYTYADLTETLEARAADRPSLFRYEAIGQSYEGRDIWLCTLTNTETGPPHEKPAVFVHAQIHAMEFTGTTAALNLLDHLLHDQDARTRHALDTRTFYVVPRVNPDGAEAGLADGRFRRSSVRPYPRDEPEDGLHRDDVDGDGRVLFMRMPGRNGSWKPHPDDARLLIARRPDDVDGDFYRVLPEGTIRNWDGVTIPVAPPFEGLDLNRNWPAEWAPESEQLGARPFPTSEPEGVRSSRRSPPARTSPRTSATTRAVRPIEVELELPDGARIAVGKEREEAGQLGGRVERRQITWWNTDLSTAERTKLEWVVEASAGDRIGVVARHERAGTVRAELVL
jgi:murein tripeptide amidase MpaA